MITVLSPAQALGRVAKSVLLPELTETSSASDQLLAQVARRAINIMAPCATHELVRAVTQSFAGLGENDEAFSDRVAAIVEDLIVYGDILEMRQSTEDSFADARGFLLRPGPPSFVTRKNGSVVILGIAGDQLTPLTADLDARTVHHGVLRIVSDVSGVDLQVTLTELGLFKMPEKTWLRLPSFETAEIHFATWQKLVEEEPASMSIEGLQVLDTARSPSYYKDRWGPPERSQTGFYIARRPQKYGASLWCLAELHNGNLRRFKDLSVAGDRLRPFDIAWRIQAALDARAGKPQSFRISTKDASTALFRFYSPLPSWCERYLAVAGQKTKADRCLFSFELPASQSLYGAQFLQEALWMTEASG
jgi:hypothetical protein